MYIEERNERQKSDTEKHGILTRYMDPTFYIPIRRTKLWKSCLRSQHSGWYSNPVPRVLKSAPLPLNYSCSLYMVVLPLYSVILSVYVVDVSWGELVFYAIFNLIWLYTYMAASFHCWRSVPMASGFNIYSFFMISGNISWYHEIFRDIMKNKFNLNFFFKSWFHEQTFFIISRNLVMISWKLFMISWKYGINVKNACHTYRIQYTCLQQFPLHV